MKSTLFMKPGQVSIESVDKPELIDDDDVIIHIVRSSVCGSDLWAYRGFDKLPKHIQNSGHEAIGIIESVGSAITTFIPGDFVIAPFTHGCGHCVACRAGFEGGCLNHKDNFDNFSTGAQAEYMRYQHAEWSLIKIPGQPDDYSEEMLKSLLTLADVMPTGYHATRVSHVSSGDTVAVIGDGAVGLCGVISAQLRGAKRIIAMSRHEDRQKLAREFGATDIVSERGNEGVEKVMDLTNGNGVDAVLECVGTEQAVDTAMRLGRPGATVGRVGVPHNPAIDLAPSFHKNTIIAGGPASVTTYDKTNLLKDVLDGYIHPGKVFTQSFKLDDIDAAYQAMDQRKAIKSLIIVD